MRISKTPRPTKHASERNGTHSWDVGDGTTPPVGRRWARIASILRGTNKAYYTPRVDCGDFIIVTNCEKIKRSGNKMDEKIYDTFSGYPGGRKEEIAKDLLKRRREVIIERDI